MLRFCITCAIIGVFTATLTESRTYQPDLDDLEDIYLLVTDSRMQLDGWSFDIDPCGEHVPCGINDLPGCPWEGIACAIEDGDLIRIVGISIEGRSPTDRLKGRLPTMLPLKLRSISLPRNSLSGDLQDLECFGEEYECSDIWWRNQDLEQINLEGNDLEGPLADWGRLYNLKSIELSSNRFNGSLPTSWGSRIHLERIELSDNRLEGKLPKEWGSLLSLQFLRLASNNFAKEIPTEWLQLSSLELLDVGGNCGICGKLPAFETAVVYGNETNLNIDCRRCNGCQCKEGNLLFVVINVMLSIAVLVALFCVWFLFNCCRSNRQPDTLPVTEFMPRLISSKAVKPTIVINPDQEFQICKQESPDLSMGEYSESETESDMSEDYTDGESSDYSEVSDTESLDPKLLAFLYKKSPMLALADRTWSDEIAGPSEIRPQGYASDIDNVPPSPSLAQRRSASALEGRSSKSNLSKAKNFLEARKSAKRVAELGPTPKQPRNKQRRRRVRSFRRRTHRGWIDNLLPRDSRRHSKRPDQQVNEENSQSGPSEGTGK